MGQGSWQIVSLEAGFEARPETLEAGSHNLGGFHMHDGRGRVDCPLVVYGPQRGKQQSRCGVGRLHAAEVRSGRTKGAGSGRVERELDQETPGLVCHLPRHLQGSHPTA